MCFFKKNKKKKSSWPEGAKYNLKDCVRFKYRNEICHGFVYEAYEKEGKIFYTLQMGGECPTFAYDYPEEKIVDLVVRK